MRRRLLEQDVAYRESVWLAAVRERATALANGEGYDAQVRELAHSAVNDQLGKAATINEEKPRA